MVLIGAHLRTLGHRVSVLTGEGHRGVVERAGLDFTLLDPDGCSSPPPRALFWNRLLPNLFRRYLLGRADIRSTFIVPFAAQCRALERLLDAEPADAVIVDLAFTGVLPLITSAQPRPAVLVCGVGPLTLSSADTPPFGMAWTPRAGMDYGGMHAVVHHVLFRGIHKELNAALRTTGAPGISVALMDWPRLADRMVQLTVPTFEYSRRDLPGNVEFVGPVLPPSSDSVEPPEWWDDVLRAELVVHVTQGTHDNGNLDQLIGPTLDAYVGQEGVVVIATTGRRADQQLSTRIPVNARVAEWIPYSALLPHVDVMITNGGYGGVHHALSYGIPVVVAGESSDKAEVAARVAHAGVGVNLHTPNPTAAQIATAVHEATTDCRDAARRLSLQIAATTPLDSIAALVVEEISRQRSATPS